jgi:hypothetical protein
MLYSSSILFTSLLSIASGNYSVFSLEAVSSTAQVEASDVFTTPHTRK